jgi:hypothetical protein
MNLTPIYFHQAAAANSRWDIHQGDSHRAAGIIYYPLFQSSFSYTPFYAVTDDFFDIQRCNI